MIRSLLAVSALALPLSTAVAQSDEGPPRWAAKVDPFGHLVITR